jgi:hypothetical protein
MSNISYELVCFLYNLIYLVSHVHNSEPIKHETDSTIQSRFHPC